MLREVLNEIEDSTDGGDSDAVANLLHLADDEQKSRAVNGPTGRSQ